MRLRARRSTARKGHIAVDHQVEHRRIPQPAVTSLIGVMPSERASVSQPSSFSTHLDCDIHHEARPGLRLALILIAGFMVVLDRTCEVLTRLRPGQTLPAVTSFTLRHWWWDDGSMVLVTNAEAAAELGAIADETVKAPMNATTCPGQG